MGFANVRFCKRFLKHSIAMLIYYINKNFLSDIQNVRRAFAAAGLLSVAVGTNILTT